MLTSIIIVASLMGIAVATKLLKSATSKIFEVTAGENPVEANASDSCNVIPETPKSTRNQPCVDSGDGALSEKKVTKPQRIRKIFVPPSPEKRKFQGPRNKKSGLFDSIAENSGKSKPKKATLNRPRKKSRPDSDKSVEPEITKLFYGICNPKDAITSEEQITDEIGYQEPMLFPAAEFDDIGVFLLFLKELKIKKEPNHLIISIQKVDGIKIRSTYCYVDEKNMHLFKTYIKEKGYFLVKKIEVI